VEAALRIGDIEIVALRDCVLSLRLDFQFPDTPRSAFATFEARYPGVLSGDRWTPAVRAFLIRSRSWTVLFDTGMGNLSSVEKVFHISGALEAELRAAGAPAETIDTVVVSHLHLDHAGGVTREDGDARVPAFPRARYWVHRADIELARDWAAGTPPYGETLVELDRRGVIVDASDGAQVNEGLTLLSTPGHTPGSLSLLVRSRGDGAILTADALPNPMLVTEPEWRFGSDNDSALATTTRIALMDRIEREGLIAVPTHMPQPFGGLVRVAGKRYWQGRG